MKVVKFLKGEMIWKEVIKYIFSRLEKSNYLELYYSS